MTTPPLPLTTAEKMLSDLGIPVRGCGRITTPLPHPPDLRTRLAETLTIADTTRTDTRTCATSGSRPQGSCSHTVTEHLTQNHPNFDGHRRYRCINAPIDNAAHRRIRHHSEHPAPQSSTA
ncbi:hypothetical protein FEZ60_27055 [Rhodococcus sp. MS16]|uniref:hypothetical protein n=1 Tax=Rhodococcus sp. MS16 TaxID=2579941 RepID=UPI0015625233|nr:hypothetical protein [Rhodococcus sp. MS16]NRI69186.1 hypothetical protein [Rhodococcus sp. MS16]